MTATATLPLAATVVERRQSPARSRLILVATDGSRNSVAAYTLAELIATQSRARVHVLSVAEPLPSSPRAPGSQTRPEISLASIEDALRADMVDQLLRLGRLAKWTTEIRAGKPAAVIAEVARERNADLVVIGANTHGILDRLMGEETASQLARIIDRPLLIVPPSMTRLPRRVVIAFDLATVDRSSLVSALEILGTPESVSAVHVEPRSEFLGVDWAEYDPAYRAEIEAAFYRLKASLAVLSRMQTELVIEHGDAAREINEFASSVHAEMVVLGVKPRNGFSVAPQGGISMRVMRRTSAAMLLIPNRI